MQEQYEPNYSEVSKCGYDGLRQFIIHDCGYFGSGYGKANDAPTRWIDTNILVGQQLVKKSEHVDRHAPLPGTPQGVVFTADAEMGRRRQNEMTMFDKNRYSHLRYHKSG